MILTATDYCPFCMRCILAMNEKGVEFELSTVDLTKKANFRKKLSPYGRVPGLEHNGKSIFESSVICEYLEEVFPEPALLPREPWLRAKARFWIDFCNTRFMPAYFNLLKSPVGTKRNKLRNELLDHLVFIDDVGLSEVCQDQQYWMGNNVSLVDFAFYPFFERFADVEEYRGVEILPSLSRLHSWLLTMRNHPSVQSIARPRAHYVAYFQEFYAD